MIHLLKWASSRILNRAHKVILASGSKYFSRLFSQPESPSSVDLPRYLATYTPNANPLSHIIKYLYGNQQLSQTEISEATCIGAYALADSLEMNKLSKDIQNEIIEKHLTPENACKYYYEGLRVHN